jgi:hypothetical protein
MRSPVPALVVCLATCVVSACSQTISPTVIADAQLVARVKTALVNDPALGVRAVEVRARRGVVRLSGRVGSEAEAQRAMALARGVAGVAAVESALVMGALDLEGPAPSPGDAATPPAGGASGISDLDPERVERNRIAVGIAVGLVNPRSSGLDSTFGAGPLVRLGRGRGLGLSFGLGWFAASYATGDGPDELGRLRIRPVMAGAAYSIRGERALLSLALVGGVAFNSIADRERSAGPTWALDLGNSFAWRPSASFWLELGPRVAYTAFGGYLVTRPRLTLLEDGQIRERTFRADAPIVRTGLVYKIF